MDGSCSVIIGHPLISREVRSCALSSTPEKGYGDCDHTPASTLPL
jgi:hypothetical protein